MLKNRRWQYFHFKPDSGGASGEGDHEYRDVPTPAVPAQVADHVDAAAQGATQAASATGEDGWKVVADELKGLRSDINKLMPAATSTPASETPATQSEPEVKVEVPKPPERKVRRGHRKVTRRG